MGNLVNSVMGVLGDGISSLLDSILYATVYKLLYYAEAGLCWLVKVVYSMFEVIAGITQVTYDGKQMFLINVFFSDDTVSKVYWGMAIMGMALCFGFAIVAVIRKTFDIGDKIKSSFGSILTQLGKSILIMCSMSLIMSMILYSTNILLQQVMYIFDSAQVDTGEVHISYDETDYAAMARILNTIGNYSLNSSYQSRYNINSCYNEIRPDLQYLERRGVFDTYYSTKDANGNTTVSWQSALQTLITAADPEKEMPLDTYNESVTRSITGIMELLRTDGSFAPLESYDVKAQRSNANVKMDALMFLMGTFEAAKNPSYNDKPSVTDELRAAYYDGDKSIYDLDTVSQDFDIGLGATNYILVGLNTILMLLNLCVIIFNCVARIYNMLFLYIIAPPVIAASPLDDGGKLKQWITAMVIQSLGVFGTVISMRLFVVFLPIVLSNKLVLMDNVLLDAICKDMIIQAALTTIKKASDMLTGILSDNAAFAAGRAADNSRAGAGFATSSATMALGAATKAGRMITAPARWAGNKIGNRVKGAINGYRAAAAMKADQQAREAMGMGGFGGFGGGYGGFGGGYGGYGGGYGGGGANWMNQAAAGGYGGAGGGGRSPANSGGGAPGGQSAGGANGAGGASAQGGAAGGTGEPQNMNGLADSGPQGGGDAAQQGGGDAAQQGGTGGPQNMSSMANDAGSAGAGGGASAADSSSAASGGGSAAGGSAVSGGGAASAPQNMSGAAASGGNAAGGNAASGSAAGGAASGGSAAGGGAASGSAAGGGAASGGTRPRSNAVTSRGSSSGGAASGGSSIPTPPPMRQNIPKPPPMPQNMNKK